MGKNHMTRTQWRRFQRKKKAEAEAAASSRNVSFPPLTRAQVGKRLTFPPLTKDQVGKRPIAESEVPRIKHSLLAAFLQTQTCSYCCMCATCWTPSLQHLGPTCLLAVLSVSVRFANLHYLDLLRALQVSYQKSQARIRRLLSLKFGRYN